MGGGPFPFSVDCSGNDDDADDADGDGDDGGDDGDVVTMMTVVTVTTMMMSLRTCYEVMSNLQLSHLWESEGSFVLAYHLHSSLAETLSISSLLRARPQRQPEEGGGHGSARGGHQHTRST